MDLSNGKDVLNDRDVLNDKDVLNAECKDKRTSLVEFK